MIAIVVAFFVIDHIGRGLPARVVSRGIIMKAVFASVGVRTASLAFGPKTHGVDHFDLTPTRKTEKFNSRHRLRCP